MPLKSGKLTVQELTFAEALARTGDHGYAAFTARYRSTASPALKAKDPAIVAQVEAYRFEAMAKQAVPKAIKAILDSLEPTANPKIRLEAGKWVLDRWREEHVSAGGEGKDPSEMTPDELSTQIRELEMLAMAKAVDVTPADDSGLFD